MDMWHNPGCAKPPDTGWLPFVGSWVESPGQVSVLLRGDLDAPVRDRLREQLATVIDTGARFITVDARGVTGCDPGIIDLLGTIQHRLRRRRGLLTVRGLHPCVLPAAESGPDPSDTPGASTCAEPAPRTRPHTPVPASPQRHCSTRGAEQ